MGPLILRSSRLPFLCDVFSQHILSPIYHYLSSADTKMHCLYNYHETSSIHNANLVSEVVQRHAEVYFLFFLLLELQGVDVGVLVLLEHQLAGGRVHCYCQDVGLVVVPGCVDLVGGGIAAPAVAVVGHLHCSVVVLLEFIAHVLY